jgi:hypothetical protein
MLASARGFWNAAQRLEDRRREADVLIGLAKEEAAKILIVLDIVRCPPKRVDGATTGFAAALPRLLAMILEAILVFGLTLTVSNICYRLGNNLFGGRIPSFCQVTQGAFQRLLIEYLGFCS